MPSGRPLGLVTYTGHSDTRLLHGCFWEAERCEIVSHGLDGLRNALPENYHAHMSILAEEIRASGRVLRDLIDRSQAHLTRVPFLL